jgi:hypothetical protein
MNSPGSTAVTSLYDIAVERMDGTMSTFGDYRGNVLLIVNVASKCGLTPVVAAARSTEMCSRDPARSAHGNPHLSSGAGGLLGKQGCCTKPWQPLP